MYLVLIAGERSPRRLDRPAAALIGAVLMVVLGVQTREQALAAIHFPTLALLFGMMVVIHHATMSGLIDRAVLWLVGRSKTPRQLLLLVSVTSGLLSALFVNDTICLLFTPIALTLARRGGLPPEPFLIAVATGANVGSAMTLTGNPQNMLIGQVGGFTWLGFFRVAGPLGLLALGVNAAVLDRVHGRHLPARFLEEELTETVPLDRKLAIKTLAVLAGLLGAFLLGAPLDLAALSAAAALLVLANRRPQETFATVDWSLLLFFGGLFVVTHGVLQGEGGGLVDRLPSLADGPLLLRDWLLLALATMAGSTVLGNVPFVMLAAGALSAVQDGAATWLLLALVSTLAGNLTLVASVANLIVVERAKDQHHLSFRAFLRVGVPSSLLTAGLVTALLWGAAWLGWL